MSEVVGKGQDEDKDKRCVRSYRVDLEEMHALMCMFVWQILAVIAIIIDRSVDRVSHLFLSLLPQLDSRILAPTDAFSPLSLPFLSQCRRIPQTS